MRELAKSRVCAIRARGQAGPVAMQMPVSMDERIDAPMSAMVRVRTDAQEPSRQLNSPVRVTRTQRRSAHAVKPVLVTVDATPNA